MDGKRGVRGPCRSLFGVLTVDRELEDLYPAIFHDLPNCIGPVQVLRED